jgi:hypothetical protein
LPPVKSAADSAAAYNQIADATQSNFPETRRHQKKGRRRVRLNESYAINRGCRGERDHNRKQNTTAFIAPAVKQAGVNNEWDD